MESGVHGVESEAAVCPGRRITGVSGSRWTSCGAGTGAGDTLEGVAGITIPPEQPQFLPKALLRHPTVRYRARRPPRRSPGLAHFVIPRPGLRQTPSGPLRAFQPQGHTLSTPLKTPSTPFPSTTGSARAAAPALPACSARLFRSRRLDQQSKAHAIRRHVAAPRSLPLPASEPSVEFAAVRTGAAA